MDTGMVNLSGVTNAFLNFDASGMQIMFRLSPTVLVALNIYNTGLSYVQSSDNGINWTTVWAK